MLLPEEIRLTIEAQQKLAQLPSQLRRIDAKKSPAVTLAEYEYITGQNALDWVEELTHCDKVYETLAGGARSDTGPLEGKEFLAHLHLKRPKLNQALLDSKRLTPLQQTLLEMELEEDLTKTFIVQLDKATLPLDDTIFAKVSQIPAIMGALTNPETAAPLAKLLAPHQLRALEAAEKQQFPLCKLKHLFSGEKPDQAFRILLKLDDAELAQACYQNWTWLTLDDRLQLYRYLRRKNSPLFEVFLANEPLLESLVTEAARNDLELLQAFIEANANQTDTLQDWLFKTASQADCSLDPILIFEKAGVSLKLPDPITGDTLFHLTARTENYDVFKYLLSLKKSRIASKDKYWFTPYHRNRAGESALDIAQNTQNRKLLDLLAYHGCDALTNSPTEARITFGHTRKEYLAFCGGGIKAVAYGPALRAYIESGYFALEEIKGAVGTSAGAIAAMLVALGYNIDEVEESFKAFDLQTLLDYDKNQFNPDDILELKTFAGEALKKTLNGGDLVNYGYQWLFNKGQVGKIKRLFNTINENGGGLCPGEALNDWFKILIAPKLTGTPLELLAPEDVTFEDLHEARDADGRKLFKDLRMMAVNINTGEVETLCFDRTPNATVLSALRASVSIPFVYTPSKLRFRKKDANGQTVKDAKNQPVYEWGKGKFVDGLLVNNYPFFGFQDKDRNHLKTYGFYLANASDADAVRAGKQMYSKFRPTAEGENFASVLYNIMLTSQDNIFSNPVVQRYSLLIPIPETFAALEFGNEEKRRALEEIGRRSALAQLARHRQYQHQDFRPQIYQYLARMGCIQSDTETHDIYITTPPPLIRFGDSGTARRRSIEIVKLYARATNAEAEQLAFLLNPNRADDDGLTALHIAYAFGLEKTVQKLLNAGANKYRETLWQADASEAITAKSCKIPQKQTALRAKLHSLGVPDYFAKGERWVERDAKAREREEAKAFRAACDEREQAYLQLRDQLAKAEDSLKSEQAASLAASNALMELVKRATPDATHAELVPLIESTFQRCLALHDDSYQALAKQLVKKDARLEAARDTENMVCTERADLLERLGESQRSVGILTNEHQTQLDRCTQLQEELNKYRSQLSSAAERLANQAKTIDSLRARLSEETHSLEQVRRQMNHMDINRLKWRKRNRIYRCEMDKLAKLITTLKDEMTRLRQFRQNLILSLFLPLLSLIFDMKINTKREKLRAITLIHQRLSTDNDSSTRDIIAEVEKRNPHLRYGFLSRTDGILSRLEKTEATRCNYDFGKAPLTPDVSLDEATDAASLCDRSSPITSLSESEGAAPLSTCLENTVSDSGSESIPTKAQPIRPSERLPVTHFFAPIEDKDAARSKTNSPWQNIGDATPKTNALLEKEDSDDDLSLGDSLDFLIPS